MRLGLLSTMRGRLAVIVLLALLPALVLMLAKVSEERRTAAVEVQADLFRMARMAASRHGALVESTRQLLIALSQLPPLRTEASEDCGRLLADLLEQYPQYSNLGLADLDGDVYCSAAPMSGAANIADRAYFQRALLSRDFATGNYQVGRITGRPSVNFGYPVFDDAGQARGVLFAALDLAYLNRLVAETQLTEGADMTAVDRDGTILARYPEPEAWVGKVLPEAPLVQAILEQREGTTEASGIDGVARFYAFAPLLDGRESGVYLSLGIPKTVALKGVDGRLALDWLRMAVVAVLSVAAAWMGGELFVARGVSGLVRATERLAAGDLSVRAGAVPAIGELQRLARAFDRMAAALEQREGERATTEAQVQNQLARLAALGEIDRSIAGSMDLRVTLQVILEQVTARLEVDAASVLLLDPTLLVLQYAAARGFRTAALRHTRLRLGEGHAGRATLERRPIHVPDLSQSAGDLSRAPLLAKEGFVSYHAVPLIAKGQVKGALEIFHRAPLRPTPEWTSFLETLAGQAAIAIDNATLFEDLQRSNADLALAYEETIEGWARALELRDRETEGHTRRVTQMTLRLARVVGIPEAELVHVRRGALLHDIGKMGIPDSILLKPGPLTEDEWAVMRRHPEYARDMLSPIPHLLPALDIPYSHHERWDGSGYPRGLKGEAIPLAARLFAVADVWDALTSDRPYRAAWPEADALGYIRAQAGKHFDPAAVDVFREVQRA